MESMRCLFWFLVGCIKIASSQNMTDPLVLNLDLTVTQSSSLAITASIIQSAISDAFIDTNTETQIHNTDELQTIADFYYLSDEAQTQFEYHAILHVPFLSATDLQRAVTFGYAEMSEADTQSFVDALEANLYNSLYSLLSSDASSLQLVAVNSLKMIQTAEAEETGDGNALLMAYASVPTSTTTTTTTGAVSDAPSTTSSPLSSTTEGTSLLGDGQSPATSIVYVERDSAASSYTFDEESSYWILLVFFLFLGCCCGCCCWYFWVKMDVDTLLRSRINDSDKGENASLEMNKEPKAGKVKSNTYDAASTEEEGKTKQRDYGSSDSESGTESDSKADLDVVVVRKHSNEVKVQYTENSSSEDQGREIERILNKGHGAKQQKDKFNTDGKRILTTKELMAKYKKKKAKPSTVKTPPANDTADGEEYQFEDQQTGIDDDPRNHPHYRPEPITPSQRKPRTKSKGKVQKQYKAAKKTAAKPAKPAKAQKAVASRKKNQSNKMPSRESGTSGNKNKLRVVTGDHGKNTRPQSAGPQGSPRKENKQQTKKSKSYEDSDDSDDSEPGDDSDEEEEEQEQEESNEQDVDDNASSSSQPPKKGYQQGTPRKEYESESETESY